MDRAARGGVPLYCWAVAALAAVAAAWLAFALLRAPSAEQDSGDGDAPSARVAKRRAARKARLAAGRADRPRPVRERRARPAARAAAPEGEMPLSAEDQRLSDGIQSALDDENLGSVRQLAELAAKSGSAEVRRDAVDALAWFGEKALVELTMFMADPDGDVRDAACDAWRTAVSQIEDPEARGDIALMGMKAVRSRDHLEFMVMEINDLSNSRQIRILEDLIGGENQVAASVAREHYEFVTGEPYEGPEAAAKWLEENPDEDSGDDSAAGD